MPIKIPADLPACAALESENIFVMTEDRAVQQDIRPLEIAIVNLMPTKIATETQLLRLLSNSPLQVNITPTSAASGIRQRFSKSAQGAGLADVLLRGLLYAAVQG